MPLENYAGMIEQFDPLKIDQQIATTRGLQQRNKLADFEFAEKQREATDAQRLNDQYRNALGQDGKFNQQAFETGVAQSGIGAKLPSIQKSFAERAKFDREADKDRLATKLKNFEIAAQIIGPVKDQATWDIAKKQTVEFFGPEAAAQMPEQYDPALIEQRRKQAMPIKDQLEQEWTKKKYDLDVDKFGYQQKNDAANRGVTVRGQDITMRGQNMTDARGREASEISKDRLAFDKSPQKAISKPMSATMQKELFEADDIVQSSQNVIDILKNAKATNKGAYSGFGAKTRAVIRSNLPGQSPGADATIDLDNMMTGQALESLKSVFGGMPTEGERKVLLEMQASSDKTPAQREAIMDRAISASEKRLKFNSSKAQSLRDGSYTTSRPGAADKAAPKGPNIDDLLKKYGG